MVAGHSYGELPALCYAGVFSEEMLVPLSEKRSGAILDSTGEDKGTMVAVNVSAERLEKLLSEGCGVYPVNHNSPRQWVLAGSTAAIELLVERLKEEKISHKQLEVACAFHSPLLAGARELFLKAMSDTELKEPLLAVWSNTTAREYPLLEEAIRERLADHLVKPVLFSDEIENMYTAGARIFVEVGPGRTLSGLTRDILSRGELIFHTEEQEGLSHLLSLAGAYMATGRTVRLEKLFEGRDVQVLDLSVPEKFKRSSTVWVVNGQMAVPAAGVLPAHGALPIVKPLNLQMGAVGGEGMHTATGSVGMSVAMNGAERMVEEYLKNMQSMIQAQRDVLMSYLGRAVPSVLPVAATMAPVVHPVKPIPVMAMDGVVENAVVVVDIKAMLLKIVSDKTGYPSDMLDLESDMEADLSIDSIKRMEIIAALKTQLGTHHSNEEDITERLASVKTLQGLINLIGGMEGGPVEEAKKIIEKGFVHEKEETMVRLRFEPSFSGINRSRAELLMGKHFAITDDAGMVSVTLKKVLEAHGAAATVISPQENLDVYDGLIVLDLFGSSNLSASSDLSASTDLSAPSDLSASRGRTNIHESFALVKKLDMSRVKWVYTVSMLRHFQGYSGFLKSLNKEWEDTVCRAINLDSELSPEKIAGLIVDELLTLDDQPEVDYHLESRKTMSLVPAELTIGHQSDIRLDKSSVVLVLGGAQGITAELMVRFSKEYPCRLVLVGRSTDPRADEDRSYVSLAGKEAIRESLIKGGQLKNPAEIERKVEDLYKRKQIMNTIRALEKNGATVDYHSLDCRDEEKLSELVRGLYRQYGRIDGVVHGAGLLEDKLLRHKTPESFERVFSTKVNPLRALAKQLRADTQFVVLFSSVASVYGNRGQTDYAAANSVMDRYARELKKQISGKVLAINWGPWKGTGMVSPALEREYERRGISLIPLTAGMEMFLNELKYGNENQVLIMAGQTF